MNFERVTFSLIKTNNIQDVLKYIFKKMNYLDRKKRYNNKLLITYLLLFWVANVS